MTQPTAEKPAERIRPVRTTDLAAKKARGERIAMLTAYDALLARLLDRAGVDVILVGDSLGMVALGYATTVPVTLDAMVHHTQAVVRGTTRALVVADMPFLTYQTSADDAVRNAGRLIQEGGASAVKLEGGRAVAPVVQRLVTAGIPVMGHVGLLPQAVHQLGGLRRQATTEPGAAALVEDALALEAAGTFAIVVEHVPDEVARRVTGVLRVPTIGIGAGPGCDGQVLVTPDLLGLSDGSAPPFVREYAHLGAVIEAAARAYVDDVVHGAFPTPRPSTPPLERE
jgi:3-methyl-2-oxobutanoate hydroxymethyltransferase